MRVGLLSDTHDHLDHLEAAVARFRELEVGLVCHGGDFVSPFALRALRDLDCRVVAVFGDNDGNPLGLASGFTLLGRISAPPHPFTVDGLRALLLHRPDGLDSLVRSQDFDLIVHGHTHRAEHWREGRTTVVNPGEGSGWTSGRATAACFDTATRAVEILPLAPPRR